jgi:hypothetical protein
MQSSEICRFALLTFTFYTLSLKRKIMAMNYGFFNTDGFRRRLQDLTDAEHITTGKNVSPAASRWSDPVTQNHNEKKCEVCKLEWRRRHPGKEFGGACE